ncbi:hypothetical protein C1645_816168 [Glomus cerebriforme]|uniref:NAD-dependent epimerase/dehydratase domain-containing protein n=1 Tax=Glomus cerebriforme TaxID=658196 RepID=A0A397THF7_9GLOM|nr:hypothetical protein C1645_816168 [Glomus cerebriforme]
MSPADRSALILGVTGPVGKTLLIDLLKSGTFKTVTTIGRKEFEYNGPNKETLVQKVVNFEKLDEYKEAFTGPFDTVFCTLGTNRAETGSAEDYLIKTEKDYVINAAKLIKQQNPSANLQFLYCSSAGAYLYMPIKTEIEQELTEIGFTKVSIFRPGLLKTDKIRDTASYIERWFVTFINWFDYMFPKKAIVHVEIVSKAIRRFATEDVEGVDIDSTIKDNGTLVEEINHKQIHEIGN